jgi:hypothetical protein
MSEILLVNPRRRTRRKTTTRRRRPAAKRRVTRRKNPVRRRAVRKVTRRRRRRNPAPRLTARSIQNNLQVASTGALGALGLDIALAYIPLPAQISGGIMGKVVKGLGAIGLGVVANMAGVSAANATRMTEGALTVQLHGIGKELLTQFAPGVALSAYMDDGLGYYGSGWNPATDESLGTYLPDISADPITMDNENLGAYVTGGW